MLPAELHCAHSAAFTDIRIVSHAAVRERDVEFYIILALGGSLGRSADSF